MKCKSVSCFLLLLTIVLTLGCSGGTKDQIVGKWQSPEKSDYIEYFRDGTVTVTSKGDSISGKWSVMDDGRIKFEVAENGKATVFKYKVSFNSNDEMTTVGEKNQVYKFTRIKP